MKRSTLLSLIASLALTLTSSTIQAQQIQQPDVPRTISYQGLLTSTDGTPLPDGPYDIAVSLFLDEAGTQPLWNATFNTDVRNGVFNILLGNDRHPLPAPLQMNRPLWAGTAVNGSPIMRPLSPLTASPYALNLPDRTVTTAKLADGAVTAEKMGTPYVAGIALNGKTITADGSVLNIEVGEGIALTYDEETRTLKLSKSAAAVQGDEEKNQLLPSALDITDANNNWLGRNAGVSQPVFEVPLGNFNTLGGGYINKIGTDVYASTISGGYTNTIDTSADYSFIGGGMENFIEYNSDHSTIAGGYLNIIERDVKWSVIGGGYNNVIDTANRHAFIGGGQKNLIDDTTQWATISGGHENTIYSDHGFIGGGHYNDLAGDASVITGGWINTINGIYSIIGGGTMNRIETDRSTVGGGESNSITVAGAWATISGGKSNMIEDSEGAMIGGGLRNEITPMIVTAANYSTISGGTDNKAHDQLGAIGGGRFNEVHAFNGTIAGGRENTITDPATTATISGGYQNTAEGLESVVAGGSHNTIWPGAYQSNISGGTANNIREGVFGSAISGGIGNNIPSGMLSTIPGGDNIIAQGYGQTALGFFNDYKGTMPFRKVGATLTQLNEPIFMIGNGDTTIGVSARSNAFEVSYNGHSIVYDENGSGGASGTLTPRGAVQGGTYRDNVIYAWADVAANGQLIDGGECADFGVKQIISYGGGRYRVELRVVGPDGITPAVIDCGAVVATVGTGAGPSQGIPTNPGTCYHIMTSSIVNNRFDVFITWDDPNQNHCVAKDAPFKFHVTGRPQ